MLIVLAAAGVGSYVRVLVDLRREWRRSRRADKRVAKSNVPGGVLTPDGLFTGVHATGVNAMEIVHRERGVEWADEFPLAAGTADSDG